MFIKIVRFMMLKKVGRFYPLAWLGDLLFWINKEIKDVTKIG